METWILYYYSIGFIFILAIILRIILASYNEPVTTKKKNLSELYTGDLLFVRYDNSLGYFMRFWSNSPWTHVAMAYRAPDDKVYIMETANYNKSRGVLFMPLEKWQILNKNCDISVMHLFTPGNYDRNRLLESFNKIKDKNLDTFGISWLRLLNKKPYKDLKNNENITCYEMIVFLLQDAGIARKDLSPSSYFPKNLIQGNLKLNDDFSFSKLKIFSHKEKSIKFKNGRLYD